MSVQSKQKIAYGIGSPSFGVFNAPIISQRDPTVRDRAELGTLWINKVTQAYYVLVSVVANVSTWVTAGNGTGIFVSVEATGGDITADVGNIVATMGNIDAVAGNLLAGGDVNVTGNVIGGGDLQITGTATVINGNLNLTNGTIAVLAGDIGVQLGNIVASAGSVIGAAITVDGDLGAPGAGGTALTNVVNTTQGAGALTMLSTNGNAGTNTGFIKMYVGATTVWVPYFDDIAP